VAPVAMQVTEDEQPAHSKRAYRACCCPSARNELRSPTMSQEPGVGHRLLGRRRAGGPRRC
jgi:hypothetical protein